MIPVDLCTVKHTLECYDRVVERMSQWFGWISGGIADNMSQSRRERGVSTVNVNAKIAELVLRTQNASDGGKNLRFFEESQKAVTDNKAGYPQKDKLILEAIRLITSSECNWKFAVTRHNGSYLVYFQTRINGEKVQISFHSFNCELARFIGRSFRIKWDHADSRESAVLAYNHYVPNGKYT